MAYTNHTLAHISIYFQVLKSQNMTSRIAHAHKIFYALLTNSLQVHIFM